MKLFARRMQSSTLSGKVVTRSRHKDLRTHLYSVAQTGLELSAGKRDQRETWTVWCGPSRKTPNLLGASQLCPTSSPVQAALIFLELPWMSLLLERFVTIYIENSQNKEKLRLRWPVYLGSIDSTTTGQASCSVSPDGPFPSHRELPASDHEGLAQRLFSSSKETTFWRACFCLLACVQTQDCWFTWIWMFSLLCCTFNIYTNRQGRKLIIHISMNT